jgi:hypothetical protein
MTVILHTKVIEYTDGVTRPLYGGILSHVQSIATYTAPTW